jgi:hypothetical protein
VASRTSDGPYQGSATATQFPPLSLRYPTTTGLWPPSSAQPIRTLIGRPASISVLTAGIASAPTRSAKFPSSASASSG